MADNVTIPATGTGSTTPIVATDQAGGASAHYQLIKLVDGTADSTTVIPGGGDGLYVQQPTAAKFLVTVGAAIAAGNNNIGDVDVASSALPTGASTLAEQQTQTASLSVMDDWDESDRAKVNPIAGQVGVQGASGVVTALTQRVVLATDVALPTGTNVIGHIIADTGSTTAVTGNVTVVQGTATNLKVDASGVAVPVTDNGGSLTVDNAGTFATQAAQSGTWTVQPGNTANTTAWKVDGSAVTQPVSLASVPSHAVTNAGIFAVQESGTQVQVDDAAFTPATSKIIMVGFEADESSTDSVDEGDGGAARMTLDRKQIVTPQPHTAGGLLTFNATSSDGATALTNGAQAIKASAGQLYGYYIYNPNATAQFVQLYNTAAGSVTVGTTNPLFMLTIPATSAANLMFTHGVTFTNAGWSCAATSTAGGNGAPSTALDAVFWYI